MKVIFLGFFVFFHSSSIQAQHLFKGSIVSEKELLPIPFASIYLANTTLGVTSDESGRFELEIPNGSYEVIVRFVGYETASFTINTDEIKKQGYQIRMRVEERELEIIEVEEERDPLWYKNLILFKQNFLGFSENAQSSEIVNETDLLLDSESNPGVLIAIPKKPLQIRNNNLGYLIEYDLQEFRFIRKKGQVFYSGYMAFTPISKTKKIAKNRLKAYLGSYTHFLQSLYKNTTSQDGYVIRKLVRKRNPQLRSEEQILAANQLIQSSTDTKEIDSLQRLNQKEARLSEYVQELYSTPLDASSLTQKDASGNTIINFSDYLHVTYTKELEELAYIGKANIGERGDQISIIRQSVKPLTLYENGVISKPFGLILEGYMAWEKVGEMMPLDYKSKPGK